MWAPVGQAGPRKAPVLVWSRARRVEGRGPWALFEPALVQVPRLFPTSFHSGCTSAPTSDPLQPSLQPDLGTSPSFQHRRPPSQRRPHPCSTRHQLGQPEAWAQTHCSYSLGGRLSPALGLSPLTALPRPGAHPIRRTLGPRPARGTLAQGQRGHQMAFLCLGV